MALLDIIKQAAIDAIRASNPVNVLYATVTKINPLEVNVDQRFSLTEDFLIIPESLSRFEIDLKHRHGSSEEALTEKIVIRKGLKNGDKVILIRVQGGQQYLVLDKVVDK